MAKKNFNPSALSQAAKIQTAANRYLFLKNNSNKKLVDEITKK